MNRKTAWIAASILAALGMARTAPGQGMDRPLVSRHYTAVQRFADQYGTNTQNLLGQGPTGTPMLVHRMYTATGRFVHEHKTARMTLVHRNRVAFQMVQAAETETLVFVSRRSYAEPLTGQMKTARLRFVDQYPTIDP